MNSIGTEPVIKSLDPNKQFALIVIEQNRDLLIQNELVRAEQNLRAAEKQLELAKAGLSEVQGAIIGANIMIERELAADGFTIAEWNEIKARVAQENQDKSETVQDAAPAVEAPAQESDPVPETPSAKVAYQKRRGR